MKTGKSGMVLFLCFCSFHTSSEMFLNKFRCAAVLSLFQLYLLPKQSQFPLVQLCSLAQKTKLHFCEVAHELLFSCLCKVFLFLLRILILLFGHFIEFFLFFLHLRVLHVLIVRFSLLPAFACDFFFWLCLLSSFGVSSF